MTLGTRHCIAFGLGASLFVLALQGARSEEQKRLAVLEFDAAPGVKIDRILFSDLARSAVNRRAPGLFVMTRESTEVLLKANNKSMSDCVGECEVEVGRKLGADYIISGRLSRAGSFLFLTMRLFSTVDGRLITSADARGKGTDGLIEQTDAALARLVVSLGGEEPIPVAGRPSLQKAESESSGAGADGSGGGRFEPKGGLKFVRTVDPQESRTIAREVAGAIPQPPSPSDTTIWTDDARAAVAALQTNSMSGSDWALVCNRLNASELYALAVKGCGQAVALNPQLPWSHVTLGHALGKLGQRDEAIQHFERALELQPSNDLILANYNLYRTGIGLAPVKLATH